MADTLYFVFITLTQDVLLVDVFLVFRFTSSFVGLNLMKHLLENIGLTGIVNAFYWFLQFLSPTKTIRWSFLDLSCYL